MFGGVDWREQGAGKGAKTTVLLLRHGETVWNSENRFQGQLDSKLTPQGRQQAAACGRRLKGIKFDAVISSDLGRAHETAKIVHQHLQGRPPLTLDPSCRERNYGSWEGKTRDEAKALCANGKDVEDKYSLDLAPEGGETRGALQLRAQNFFISLLRQHRGSTVLVVTHGAFMQEAIKGLLGVGERVRGRRGTLKTENGCLTRMSIAQEDGEWSFEYVGDTSHLEREKAGGGWGGGGSWVSLLVGVGIGVAATLFVGLQVAQE